LKVSIVEIIPMHLKLIKSIKFQPNLFSNNLSNNMWYIIYNNLNMKCLMHQLQILDSLINHNFNNQYTRISRIECKEIAFKLNKELIKFHQPTRKSLEGWTTKTTISLKPKHFFKLQLNPVNKSNTNTIWLHQTQIMLEINMIKCSKSLSTKKGQ